MPSRNIIDEIEQRGSIFSRLDSQYIVNIVKHQANKNFEGVITE